MASGKADGSLLTIVSSPIMLQERSARSTYYALSPHGKKVARGCSFLRNEQAQALCRSPNCFLDTQFHLYLFEAFKKDTSEKATFACSVDAADDTFPSC